MRSVGALGRAVFVALCCATRGLLAQDCDRNGVDDAADIQAGTSADCNQNGTPDVCEIVPLVFGTIGEPLASVGAPQLLTSEDLDGDGRDELYVASDKHKEVRRYTWNGRRLEREVIYVRPDDRPIFTWNLMPVPAELIPE